MSVLVIDPNKDSQAAAIKVIRWADHRHNIEFAADGASAWPVALQMEPGLIFCETDLPDIGGGTLCEQLRTRLPSTTFIAYTNQDHESQSGALSAFDGVLRKPPCRFQTMSYLKAAQKKRKQAARARTHSFLDETPSRTFNRNVDACAPNTMEILVSMAEDDLKFTMPLPTGATVGRALQQMGKGEIAWFGLVRESSEVAAGIDTPMHQGDVLKIKM